MAPTRRDENTTAVIFRKYPDGEVIALFPEEPAQDRGGTISCYVHVGQHGEADYWHVVRHTRLADPLTDAAELSAELERIGYRLAIYRRRTTKHRSAFRAAQREGRLMGYTHYWSLSRDLTDDETAALIADVRVIVAASGVPVAGWDGRGDPTYGEDSYGLFVVALNGGCETFRLSTHKGWDFCKTRQLPYDVVVTASLIAAKDRLGSAIRLSSDGEAEDWHAGRMLASRALGKAMPPFVHEQTLDPE